MQLVDYINAKEDLKELLDQEADEEEKLHIQKLIHRADAKIEQAENGRKSGHRTQNAER